ncbi:MAG: ABC transporter permease [Muribaculaceae bacterium]|nr:ABC transporter permease [Muribaculaceae bacterium]
MNNTLIASLRRGVVTLVSRPIYLMMMVIVPVAVALFFVDLMKEGLPLKAPVGVVDLDHSTLSRRVMRTLNASELTDIVVEAESFHEAMAKVQQGEIFGFFYIPANFEQQTLAGKSPTLSFYSNMTFFVPGTLSFKGFKTTAVSVTAGVVTASLTAAGASEDAVGSMLQPIVVQDHPIGNPWLNYAIYLCNSFIPGVICLLVMMMTVFSVMTEIKHSTSPEWLRVSGGSMVVALVGKLLPQTVIFTAIGWMAQALMFKFCHYPLNCPAWHILLAMALLVLSSQGFSLAICELVPSFRLALSGVSLIGILSFSIAGFSFPVTSMYGAIGVFSYILPVRWYFLVYADQALNGIPLYYSRWYYIAMLIFMLVPFIGLRRLKSICLRPVYLT